ncbi:hypothetical protein FA15DRAFT_760305 [Coprinopsis marcescibilis]|uniref:Hemerythrin-like domain-containing protein n=1 Tax=Coprinopsis marcescibilis TaxID=230819 RepID=A0A5C3KT58_COPMA|nr:hypothetical protein FA15DRAFT_760305 [Coprinopsis marcescibilis]
MTFVTISRSGVARGFNSVFHASHFVRTGSPFRASYPNVIPAASRMMSSTEQPTLSEAVMSDFDDIDVLADEYRRFRGDKNAQARWANQLTWTVARHGVGSELVIYPLLEKHFHETGSKLANEGRAGNQSVKERLYALESLQPGTLKYNREFEGMMNTMESVTDRETEDDLPMLEDALGTEGSQEAAARYNLTKQLAPTRPHPSNPSQPLLDSVVSLLEMPLDKLKDQFTKFPTQQILEESKNHIG